MALSLKVKAEDKYSGALLKEITKQAGKDATNADQVIAVTEDLRKNGILKPVLDEGKRRLLRANPQEYIKLAEEENGKRLATITAATLNYAKILKDAGLDDASVASIGRKYEEIMLHNDDLFNKIEFPDNLYEEAKKTVDHALRINMNAA